MAWLRVPATESSSVHSLGAALRAEGLHDGDPWAPAEPGVIVADGISAETIASLTRPSDGRVLVVLTSTAGTDPWELLLAGAADVVPMGDRTDVTSILARLRRWAAVDELVDSEQVRAAAVGTSTRWRNLLREVVEIARFTRSPVLLTGETGTGKEVVARLIDALDERQDKPELELVDCTTIVPTLMGSELFGHEKGAFTGATVSRQGAFALADGGTLFLDEVGELPTALQPALLRVVQEGTYKAIGSNRWRATRFRLLAATNRDLADEIDAGRFRRDLYYRLAAATVRVPPLRERREDIVPLFRHFLTVQDPTSPAPELMAEVAAALIAREYPGNVRDLRQLALRVAARHVGGGPITPGDLPPEDRPTVAPRETATGWRGDLQRAVDGALADGVGLQSLKETAADLATQIALARTGGATAAARLLGVSRRAVDYRTSGRARSDGARADAAATPEAVAHPAGEERTQRSRAEGGRADTDQRPSTSSPASS